MSSTTRQMHFPFDSHSSKLGPNPLELFTDFERRETTTVQTESIHFTIDHRVIRVLGDLSGRYQVSPSVPLVSAFLATLFSITGTQDDWVKHFSRGFTAAKDHDDTFEKLMLLTRDEIIDGRSPGGIASCKTHSRHIYCWPFSRVLFSYCDVANKELETVQGTVDIEECDCDFSISLCLSLSGDALHGEMVYLSDLFLKQTVATVSSVFQRILEVATQQPSSRLSHLSLATPDHLQKISRWNSGNQFPSPHGSLGELFRKMAIQRGPSLAVQDRDTHLSYDELNERTDRLACWLLSQKLEQEEIVGVYMERSVSLVIAYLGCLKAGLAYMPLERSLPEDRLRLMVENTKCRLILACESCPLSKYVSCVDLSKRVDIIESTEIKSLPTVTDNQLCNILFTSGSTGLPKGVLIEHRGMVNLCAPETSNWPDRLRRGLTAGISFDISGYQIFASLLSGSKLYILADDGIFSPTEFQRFIIEFGVEEIMVTPSILNALLDDGSEWLRRTPLKRLILGGEPAEPAKIMECRLRLADLEILNCYGPTEASVQSSYFKVPPSYDSLSLSRIPIGRPLPNTSIYIVDGDLNLAPPGVVGEIVVAGVSLARGYINQPLLTAERFIKLPDDHPLGSRIFRVGDLGYWTSDGVIQYIGRKDTQLKIRGQRIEAGEIELALNRHPAVHSAIVVIVKARTVDQLVAYFTQRPEFSNPVCGSDLKNHLRRTLPQFMVPNWITRLESIPMTHAGKVDRQQLSSSSYMEAHVAVERNLADLPLNTTEQKVLDIFASALGVPRKAIDTTDSLFNIGGDSMTATRIISAIRRRFSLDLSIMQILDEASVQGIASAIDAKSIFSFGCESAIPRHVDCQLQIPASNAQTRLWVEEQMNPGLARYNAGFQRKLVGECNLEALSKAFNYLVDRHEALRTVFNMPKDVLLQSVIPTPSNLVRLTNLPDASGNIDERARSLLSLENCKPFDLTSDLPIRVIVIRTSNTKIHYVSVIIHHIATDGWSAQIFDRELAIAYNSFKIGQNPALDPLPISYRDYSIWQNARSQGDILETQLDYWRSKLSDVAPLELPQDYIRPQKLSGRAREVVFDIDSSTVNCLRELARVHQTSLYVILLAAFRATIYRVTGQEDGTLGMANANRPSPELEGIVGFFVNTHAIRLQIQRETSFSDLISQTRVVTAEAVDHSVVPFDKVVAHISPDRDLSRNPLAQLMFVLQDFTRINGSRSKPQLDGVTSEEIRFASSRLDLSVHIYIEGDGLRGYLMYQTDLFSRPSIKTFTNIFQRVMRTAVESPSLSLSKLRLVSPTDLSQIEKWNSSENLCVPVGCIGDRFRDVAIQRGLDLAIREGDQYVSYQDLNERTDAIARWLVGKNMQHEEIVGIWMRRSILLVTAYLGCLKAGLAYMPLDNDLPADRLRIMVTTAKCRLVLTAGDCPLARYVDCVNLSSRLYTPDTLADDPLPVVKERQLCNVMFTSGSTGTPKGVMIEHRSMVNLCASETSNWSGRLRSGFTSRIGFDPSGFQIFSTLLSGSELHVFPENTVFDPVEYQRRIITYGVERLWFTPSILAALLADGGQWLEDTVIQHIMLGGEPLDPSKIAECRRILPHLQVVSSYGPTEATVRSTFYDIPYHYDNQRFCKIPLGRSLPNTATYIVDEDLNPVPVGVLGEIVVGGVHVARGYLNQPQLTADRFLDLPAHHPLGPRVYCVGDFGYWTSDGLIQYMGRKDEQFKLRGQRMEAGEIEATLKTHPAVQSSAVVVCKSENNEQLVAYYVKRRAEVDVPREEGILALWCEHYDNDFDYSNLDDSLAGHDFARWFSMYDGNPIPDMEMREWLDDTIEQIAPFASDAVLEVGVGTGQIALSIAHRVESYFGTDISSSALNYLARQANRRDLRSKLSFSKCGAHDLHSIPQQNFTLAIINSVIQYFPSAEYLVKVIEQVIDFMPNGGRIFLGDIRSHSLIAYHNLERALASLDSASSLVDVMESLKSFSEGQVELLVSPAFFFDLQSRLTSIVHVEIKPKLMNARNELSRYRYNAVLHVLRPPELVKPARWVDFADVGTMPEDISSVLNQSEDSIIGITNIPIQDLQVVEHVLSIAEQRDAGQHISDLSQILNRDSLSRISVPAVLHQSSLKSSFDMALDYTHQERSANFLRAVFTRVTPGCAGTSTIAEFPVPKFQGPFHSVVALPSPSNYQMAESLKTHLRRSLPEFMIPSRMVCVGTLPMNTSGKLNRKLLASPNYIEKHDPVAIPPRSFIPLTDTQHAVLGIFANALSFPSEQINIDDSLFNMGGHSLMATSVVAAIRREMGVVLPMASFFRKPNVRDISALIDNDCSGSSSGTSITIDSDATIAGSTIMSNFDREGPTLFLFPEANGIASVYSSSFETLSCKVVAFGDEHWGQPLNGDTIEGMARSYINQILSIQSTGPFHLAGWSFGGYMALEVALQLESAGHCVPVVIMADSSIWDEPLKTLDLEWRPELDHLLSVVNDRSAWLTQFARTNSMISNYQVPVGKYDGKVVLFKALHGRAIGDHAPPPDPHNGWLPYIPQIDVRGIESTHRKMFDYVNGPLMGSLFSQILEEVR